MDETSAVRRVTWLLLLCLSGLHAVAGADIERFTVGTDARPWGDWGAFDAIDDQSLAGWIQPRWTSLDVNILQELYINDQLFAGRDQAVWTGFRPDQDGRIWSPNVPPAENKELLKLADGRRDSLSFDKFDRLTGNTGVSISVDLGIPYPVSQISFYPLDFGTHADLFIKGYELEANDGSPEKTDEYGEPIYTLLDAEPINTESVVRNGNFPSQHLRYIRLTSTSPQAFELDQLEIRGEGYVSRAGFTSQIIDLGDIVNFGRIFWAAVQDSGSRLTVQTRLGRDRTTLIYNQINELGEEEPLRGDTDEVNRRAYDRLPAPAKGGIEVDTDNWTLWSAPYSTSGQKVAGQVPRQFIQFRVTLETERPANRARVDSLAVEFSRPVMGRRIVGQVTPRQDVDLGVEQTFTYVIDPDIDPSDIGFDTVELFTPGPAKLESVKIRGRTIPSSAYMVQSGSNTLSVRLLDREDRIEADDDLMELVFDASLLIYGSVFSGQVSASWEADLLPQQIEEAKVGDLVVLGSVGSLGRVLGEVVAAPGVFTPNGDGANDRFRLLFQVTQVIGEAPLRVRIYDLSGRLVATLLDRPAASDNFQIEWDGKDAEGRLVPSGLYLYRVAVEGDREVFVRTGPVGVVY